MPITMYGVHENLSNLTYHCRLVLANAHDSRMSKPSNSYENNDGTDELNSRSAKSKSKRLFHLSPQVVEYLRFLQFLNR